MKKNNNIINEKIRADQVILIDVNGDNLGLVNTDVALKKAKDINMDLVMVSNQSSNPVVCKMLDFGKYIFDKKKNLTNSKSKVKKQTLKEIKFRPNTDIGDFNIKLKKIKSFINDGNKTKISVRFRGREILNSNLGLDLLSRLQNELSDIAQVDQEPSRRKTAINDTFSVKKEIIMGYKLKTHSGAAKRFKNWFICEI